MHTLDTLTFEAGIMPILFAEQEGIAERIVTAIEQTTMPVVEILQRGETAFRVLCDAAKCKKTAYIGAGTVCSLEQCKKMVDAGADFVVSPGFNTEMVAWCLDHNIPIVPAVSTTSELMMAADMGLRTVKFFPFNELGGESYLSAFAGPFPDYIKFSITGCLDDRALHYLSNHRIACIGGVWMFQGEVDHTPFTEEEIIRRMNYSLDTARHYRYGW